MSRPLSFLLVVLGPKRVFLKFAVCIYDKKHLVDASKLAAGALGEERVVPGFVGMYRLEL